MFRSRTVTIDHTPERTLAGPIQNHEDGALNPGAEAISQCGTVVALAPEAPLSSQLKDFHQTIKARYDGISRIAFAIHDAASNTVKTFASSNDDGVVLEGHEASLTDVPSLAMLANQRQDRIIHDIAATGSSTSVHGKWLREQGYRSSFTRPLYQHGRLIGFMFFDSKQPGYFKDDVIRYLYLVAEVISHIYLNELSLVRALKGALKLARTFAKMRDSETANHSDRLAHYSRMIARALPPALRPNDEFIEHLFLFAPLHDVGKVGIPDAILLKRGKLTDDEMYVMRTHVSIGEHIITRMMADMELGDAIDARVLMELVSGHHECIDGSGYPRGARGEAVPLAARIVTVADIFDALTSERPYKRPWTNDAAFAELERMAAIGKIDEACVTALKTCEFEIKRTQLRFADHFDGDGEAA